MKSIINKKIPRLNKHDLFSLGSAIKLIDGKANSGKSSSSNPIKDCCGKVIL